MLEISDIKKGEISLTGAVIMIVGSVVGAGIYIMIGPLAVATGPGLLISYTIALVIAVASSICYAQMSSVFPTTAATYSYARMFYSEYIGFLIGWLRWISGFYVLALMGLGFAGYFQDVLRIDGRIVAIVILTIFYIVNLLGIQTTQRVQGLLVVVVLTGLTVFCVFGIFHVRLENLNPILGAGVGPVLKGSITAFFAYSGMYFVAEIGEEIKDSHKNIPKSIFIASAIIGVLYLTTSLVFAAGLGWPTIKSYHPNLGQASSLLFSPRIAAIVRFSAIMAIIAPINTVYVGVSRFLYSLAKNNVMPSIFSKLNRFGVPGISLTLNYFLALIIVSVNMPILYLGTISSIVTLAGMSLVAGACIKVRKYHNEEFQRAPFKLSKPALYLWSGTTIITAIILSVVSLYEDPSILVSLFIWGIVGSVYYAVRKEYCKKYKDSIKINS